MDSVGAGGLAQWSIRSDAGERALLAQLGEHLVEGPGEDDSQGVLIELFGGRLEFERLCRYMARPPVCQERLSVTESGQVVVRFKRVRYHGVLAARAAVRSEVVPGVAPEQPEPIQLRLAVDGETTPLELELEPALEWSR